MKLTADNRAVPSSMALLFTPFAYHKEKALKGISAFVEMQQDGTRKRPYLCVSLGVHVFQSGWLWESAEQPKEPTK